LVGEQLGESLFGGRARDPPANQTTEQASLTDLHLLRRVPQRLLGSAAGALMGDTQERIRQPVVEVGLYGHAIICPDDPSSAGTRVRPGGVVARASAIGRASRRRLDL